jgi:hypothetical protein
VYILRACVDYARSVRVSVVRCSRMGSFLHVALTHKVPSVTVEPLAGPELKILFECGSKR